MLESSTPLLKSCPPRDLSCFIPSLSLYSCDSLLISLVSMRALCRPSRLLRGCPAYPRVPVPYHCRPQISTAPTKCHARLYVSSTESQSSQGHQQSSGNSSPFWTPSKILFALGCAAGLGYGYGVSGLPSQSQSSSQPQYGSADDFKKV